MGLETAAAWVFALEEGLVKARTGSPCESRNMYTFSYDGLGDRIQETGPSGSKTYTNTYVGSTTTKTVYLYAGFLPIASVSGSTT